MEPSRALLRLTKAPTADRFCRRRQGSGVSSSSPQHMRTPPSPPQPSTQDPFPGHTSPGARGPPSWRPVGHPPSSYPSLPVLPDPSPYSLSNKSELTRGQPNSPHHWTLNLGPCPLWNPRQHLHQGEVQPYCHPSSCTPKHILLLFPAFFKLQNAMAT